MPRTSMLLIRALIIRAKRPAKIAEAEEFQKLQAERTDGCLTRIVSEIQIIYKIRKAAQLFLEIIETAVQLK